MHASGAKVDFDELMARIRTEVERRRPPPAAPPPAGPPGGAGSLAGLELADVEAHLWAAERVQEVGSQLPPMHRQQGLKRGVATLVGKAVLRAAELITRDQRDFNREVLASSRAAVKALREHQQRLAGVLDGLEAELRTERQARAGREAQLEARLAALTEEARAIRGTLAGPGAAATGKRLDQLEAGLEALRRAVDPSTPPESHRLDAMYLEFEDSYRGTRQSIADRARAYLLEPLRAAGAGTPERPVLDLGSGRGELLELLGAEGMTGRGVDTNRLFVGQCLERGLEVKELDALSALRALPAASLGAVTAIHVLEHLPFEVLVEVIDETVRVLMPGGVAIFETPNPTNLKVGASDFHRDPTHRNPLHPETLRFVAERRGLVRVSTLPLHPAPAEEQLPDDGTEPTRRLNQLLYGPRDFAVIGHRA